MIRLRARDRASSAAASGGGGGGGSATGTVTTPSTVYAGNTAFVSGSISGATSAKVRLYSVTDSAYSGAAVDAYVASGTWVCGNLPATASTAKTYRVDLLASDGVTVIQAGSSFTTSVWTKPADNWRATIATGQASATNGQGIFDSSAVSADMTALQASSTGKTLPTVSVGAATLGTTITTTSVGQTYGDNFVVVSATAHGLVAGDWVNMAGAGFSSAVNLPITYVDANTFRVPINGLAATTNAALTGVTIKRITPVSRTIGFALTSPQAPGALIYVTDKFNLGHTLSATVSTSSFTDPSPAAATVVMPRPTTYNNADNYYDRGALVQVPANSGGTSFVKITVTNYDATTGYFYFGAFQLRSDNNHSLWLLHGPSITHYALQVLELRAYYQALYPGSDPIFINYGYPGAKYATIKTTAVDPSMASGVPWGFALIDANPNDVGDQTTTTQRPYATNNGASNVIANDLDTIVTALKAGMPAGRPVFVANGDYFNAPDKQPVVVVKSGGNTGNGTLTGTTICAKNGVFQLRMTSATTFTITDPDGLLVSYLGSTSLPTATTIDSRFIQGLKINVGGTAFVAGDGWNITATKAVDGLRSEAMGMKPFNDNLIVPKMRAMTGAYAMRTPMDAPQSDAYTGPALLWDVYPNTEGTHPAVGMYPEIFEFGLLPAFRLSQTGEPGPTRLEEVADAAALGTVPAVWKTRFDAVASSLPATSNTVAAARRAQISATVAAAAAASYSEPTVPTGATPLSWMDPARADLVTLSSGLLVDSVTDRIGGWSWVPTQYNASNPNPAPAYMPAKVKGRHILRFGTRAPTLGSFGGATGLECTAAGFLATVATAANAACTFVWVERSHPTAQYASSGGTTWQMSNVSTNLAQFYITGSTPLNSLTKGMKFGSSLLTETSAGNAWSVSVYAMVYAGGTGGAWTLYRNGASVASGTVTKADWSAATILRLGMNSINNGSAHQCDIMDWMTFSGALSTANRQAWETYLTSKWV